MRGPFHPKSRPSPGLLVLSGLDGSGKSTQASLLTRRLLNAGYQVKTVWNRWEPMISAPLIRIAKRHLKTNEKVTADNYTDFTEAKQRRMKSPWKRSLWQFMVWSEYGLQVNLRLLPYFIRRTGLICDRYVYDTMIDIA
ncbi:MAG: hypothetical protein KAX38_00855, partial [Candidatus Krumholzibacteria bacterium]|nr:hypothetical protein [Candidatus Krumholzibacteria bacterium]